MVILAPAWAPAVEWLPLGFDQFSVFLGGLSKDSPPGCEIIEMDTAQVIASVDHLLTQYPPSEEARRQRVERSVSRTRT
jgi:hypothetical protein